MPMTKVDQVLVGPMMNFTYIIEDESSKTCAVIDPGWEGEKIKRIADEKGFSITHILFTHTHFDHIDAFEDIYDSNKTKVFVHVLERDKIKLDDNVVKTVEGTFINLGETKIVCLHTPGHSPGSQCFMFEDKIFTGDTLFIDACGRVDLPGSSPEDMEKSLARISSLNSGTTIYPGHHYGKTYTDTIAGQLITNPFFK